MTTAKTYEARTVLWRAIRRLEVISIVTLRTATALSDRTIYDYLTLLHGGGYLRQVRAYDPNGPVGNCAEYRLRQDKDTGPHAPYRKGGALVDPNLNQAYLDKRTRLWNAIRTLQVVTSRQLAGVTQQNRGAIHRYLKFLADKGYLRVVERNTNKPGSCRAYRLIDDSGVHAPLKRRDGSLYDPNRPTKGKEESCVA